MNDPSAKTPSAAPLPLSLFDFELPEHAIAQQPASPPDSSRLMVVRRDALENEHRIFRELPQLLAPNDLLVINRSQVIPARLQAQRPTGGQAELLFFEPRDGGIRSAKRWLAMGRPAKALRRAQRVHTPDGTQLEICAVYPDGSILLEAAEPILQLLERLGEMPLPPYIERPNGPTESDRQDYQSIFAKEPGAVAAPTASLHFTDRVMEHLEQRRVAVAELVLHVGPGTFQPVRSEHSEDVRQHHMHREWYSIPASTVRAIEATREHGGRVVAVGTTVVRALESYFATGVPEGDSELFIYPGFEFRAVDALITNFHLPKSTLLMLVSAFASRERMLAAYQEAVREGYRFFSYGDAMLLL